MVGKLPNCSQARRSRTEERKRDLWIRQSPTEVKAELCSRHRVSQLQARAGCQKTKSSLRIERSIFFLTSPFIEPLPRISPRFDHQKTTSTTPLFPKHPSKTSIKRQKQPAGGRS